MAPKIGTEFNRQKPQEGRVMLNVRTFQSQTIIIV